MGIKYIAAVSKEHYESFKMILTTPLPGDYDMWLRVRERGKFRALLERGTAVREIEVSPIEFGNYCRGLKQRDFSIASLDECARAKAIAQEKAAAVG